MNKEIVVFLEKIEEYLLKSNIHLNVVETIMNFLAHKIIQHEKLTKRDIIDILQTQLTLMIKKYIKDFDIENSSKPYVMLVCGINGSGKTTTIGKMVNLLKECDWNVLVAGCDTYRAGAEKQLSDWIKDKTNDFISIEKLNETPSKIAIKAYKLAKEKNKDVLIIDTSGRLQNDQDLMAELLKIKHKLKEISNKIPHDVVLVIDASSGYNAMEQAKMYNDLVGVTGIIATKIDLAKRPGIILSICSQFNIKIFGVCNGEEKDKISDLEPEEFTKSILCDIDKIL